jgi:hypothetical protein
MQSVVNDFYKYLINMQKYTKIVNIVSIEHINNHMLETY